uniref:GCN5-related N-acetyltransferase n=1 Tax=Cyanothece sp. (strain PCC 7425 / ATCC 29141) TaxID=395961 RepID=B8HYB6_CYAP4
MTFSVPGYGLHRGNASDRSLLIQFMQAAYTELYPQQPDFDHLVETVTEYFTSQTPLWFVQTVVPVEQIVGGLWLGNAIDQVGGDRCAYIFLVYVLPQHRRRGLGQALLAHAENWARQRGDRQISLQVFCQAPSLSLYQRQGYQTQSLWLVKSLKTD